MSESIALPKGLTVDGELWVQFHPAAQALITQMHDMIQLQQKRIEALEARLAQHSQNSSRPPSSDLPGNRPPADRRKRPGKPGARRGHRGRGQRLLAATETIDVKPDSCPCGQALFATTEPYYTHQVIELPPIEVSVRHWVLHRARCAACGCVVKAAPPPDQTTGYGPRLSALIGELAGIYGTSRRLVQAFCTSVLRVPISLGTIQKVLDRVSLAISPHYEAIASEARQAPVAYIDETPWYRQGSLEWLWTMVSDRVAFYMINARRSKAAFFALIEQWAGILVSDGYGVYQNWVSQRQTCLAHLIRTARGLSERRDPVLSACGRWAMAELKRLCQMAHAPPTGGAWLAWYGRLCRLIGHYHDRQDDAGRFVRRLLREMDSLWVFLSHHGVDTTNNRAERALRYGVTWRKRSQGTSSDKGNAWVQHILSLRETCRLRGMPTYEVLVDAVDSLFTDRQPNLAWISQS